MGIRHISSVVKITNISDSEKTVRELLEELQKERNPFDLGFNACLCATTEVHNACPSSDGSCDYECSSNEEMRGETWNYIERECDILSESISPGKSISLTVKEGSENGRDGLFFEKAEDTDTYKSASAEMVMFTADYH